MNFGGACPRRGRACCPWPWKLLGCTINYTKLSCGKQGTNYVSFFHNGMPGCEKRAPEHSDWSPNLNTSSLCVSISRSSTLWLIAKCQLLSAGFPITHWLQMANSSAIGDWKFWLAVQTRKTAPRGSERRRRDQKLAHSGGERKRSRKGGKALEIEESPVGGGTNIRSGGQKR
jgi:hypothetical protein